MAIFDPSKYEDDGALSMVAPAGKYPLFAHEQTVKTSANDVKYIELKLTFDDGPRKGKWFYHRFFLWNQDAEKRKKALTWFGNFCRSIDLGAFDPEEDGDKMLNKIFIGDVTVESDPQYGDKNVLLPWGFHKVGGDAPAPKTRVSAPQGIGDPQTFEDDIPF